MSKTSFTIRQVPGQVLPGSKARLLQDADPWSTSGHQSSPRLQRSRITTPENLKNASQYRKEHQKYQQAILIQDWKDSSPTDMGVVGHRVSDAQILNQQERLRQLVLNDIRHSQAQTMMSDEPAYTLHITPALNNESIKNFTLQGLLMPSTGSPHVLHQQFFETFNNNQNKDLTEGYNVQTLDHELSVTPVQQNKNQAEDNSQVVYSRHSAGGNFTPVYVPSPEKDADHGRTKSFQLGGADGTLKLQKSTKLLEPSNYQALESPILQMPLGAEHCHNPIEQLQEMHEQVVEVSRQVQYLQSIREKSGGAPPSLSFIPSHLPSNLPSNQLPSRRLSGNTKSAQQESSPQQKQQAQDKLDEELKHLLSKSSRGHSKDDEKERQKKSDRRLISVNDEGEPVEEHQEGATGKKDDHQAAGGKKDVGTGSGYLDRQADLQGDRAKQEVMAKQPTNSADQTQHSRPLLLKQYDAISKKIQLHKTRQVTASALHYNVEVHQQNLNTQDSKTTIALERSLPLSRHVQQHTNTHQHTSADHGQDDNLFLSLSKDRRHLVHKSDSSQNHSRDRSNIQIKSNMSHQSNVGSKSGESDSQSDQVLQQDGKQNEKVEQGEEKQPEGRERDELQAAKSLSREGEQLDDQQQTGAFDRESGSANSKQAEDVEATKSLEHADKNIKVQDSLTSPTSYKKLQNIYDAQSQFKPVAVPAQSAQQSALNNSGSSTSLQFLDLQFKNLSLQRSLALLAIQLEDTNQMSKSKANLLLDKTQQHIQSLELQSRVMEEILQADGYIPLDWSLETLQSAHANGDGQLVADRDAQTPAGHNPAAWRGVPITIHAHQPGLFANAAKPNLKAKLRRQQPYTSMGMQNEKAHLRADGIARRRKQANLQLQKKMQSNISIEKVILTKQLSARGSYLLGDENPQQSHQSDVLNEQLEDQQDPRNVEPFFPELRHNYEAIQRQKMDDLMFGQHDQDKESAAFADSQMPGTLYDYSSARGSLKMPNIAESRRGNGSQMDDMAYRGQSQLGTLQKAPAGSSKFSGTARPLARSEAPRLSQMSRRERGDIPIGEQADLKRLAEELVQGMSREPFNASTLKACKMDRLKHALQTELETNQRVLNKKYERFGPQRTIKDAFNQKLRPQLSPQQKQSLNPNFIRRSQMDKQLPVLEDLNDHVLRRKSPNGGSFLNPSSVLDGYKRFKWDLSKQLHTVKNARSPNNQQLAPRGQVSPVQQNASPRVPAPLQSYENFNASQHSRISSTIDHSLESQLDQIARLRRSDSVRKAMGLNYRYGAPADDIDIKKLLAHTQRKMGNRKGKRESQQRSPREPGRRLPLISQSMAIPQAQLGQSLDAVALDVALDGAQRPPHDQVHDPLPATFFNSEASKQLLHRHSTSIQNQPDFDQASPLQLQVMKVPSISQILSPTFPVKPASSKTPIDVNVSLRPQFASQECKKEESRKQEDRQTFIHSALFHREQALKLGTANATSSATDSFDNAASSAIQSTILKGKEMQNEHSSMEDKDSMKMLIREMPSTLDRRDEDQDQSPSAPPTVPTEKQKEGQQHHKSSNDDTDALKMGTDLDLQVHSSPYSTSKHRTKYQAAEQFRGESFAVHRLKYLNTDMSMAQANRETLRLSNELDSVQVDSIRIDSLKDQTTLDHIFNEHIPNEFHLDNMDAQNINDPPYLRDSEYSARPDGQANHLDVSSQEEQLLKELERMQSAKQAEQQKNGTSKATRSSFPSEFKQHRLFSQSCMKAKRPQVSRRQKRMVKPNRSIKRHLEPTPRRHVKHPIPDGNQIMSIIQDSRKRALFRGVEASMGNKIKMGRFEDLHLDHLEGD